MKVCSCCKAEKDLSFFQKRAASKDGLTASCKSCLKERDRVRDQKPERKAFKEAYCAGRGKQKANEAKARWLNGNPKKRKAHNLVWSAIRKGEIKQLPCEICGANKAVAHHDDYDKPLTVRFLCPVHHEEWHREHGEAANAHY